MFKAHRHATNHNLNRKNIDDNRIETYVDLVMRELREVQGVNMDRIKIPRLYLSSFGYIKGCGIFKVQVQSSHQTKSVAGGLQVTHYCEFTKYIKFHNFIKIQYKIQFFLIYIRKCLQYFLLFSVPLFPHHI